MFQYETEIKSMEGELFEIYQDLHRHPELGFYENRTAQVIADWLRQCGIEPHMGVGLTGVYGTLDSGKPGRTIMLRADMDCLPIQDQCGLPYASENEGFCHACGHDSHVTMLLGAAKFLSTHKELFRGRVRFAFQPCEEGVASGSDTEKMLAEHGFSGNDISGPSGARFMIQDGVLEGVDACVGIHIQPAMPLGTVSIAKKFACVSTDRFLITYTGRSGHGSRPYEAIDPVPAIAELVLNLHVLPTREVKGSETVVLHIGELRTPQSTWSTIPDQAILYGGFRTVNPETRAMLKGRVEEIAAHIAAANRCNMDIVHTVGSSPVINDEALSQQIADACRALLGRDKVYHHDEPLMVGEDIGDYFREVPGTLIWLGISTEPDPPMLHNPRLNVSSSVLPLGVSIHVNNVLTYLNDQ